MAMKITKENFEAEVMSSSLPVVIDFWADWCGPCKMLTPVIEALADEFEGKVKIGKINVDEEQELSAMFKIASIPTVIKIENGTITKSSIGFRTKEQLIEILEL